MFRQQFYNRVVRLAIFGYNGHIYAVKGRAVCLLLYFYAVGRSTGRYAKLYYFGYIRHSLIKMVKIHDVGEQNR